jgi:hypothetical protein
VAKEKDSAAAPAPPGMQADLQLLKSVDTLGCQSIVTLTNNLP